MKHRVSEMWAMLPSVIRHALVAVGILGCGDAGLATEAAQDEKANSVTAAVPSNEDDSERLGADVDAVALEVAYHYLISHGYLPGLEAAKPYPSWGPNIPELQRPVVYYEEKIQAGLVTFQRDFDLPPTGRIDPSTLALMYDLRCASCNTGN